MSYCVFFINREKKYRETRGRDGVRDKDKGERMRGGEG